ncbi:hypothetical protein BH09BAC3_BH09BAC3_26610 [soil metagenome]
MKKYIPVVIVLLAYACSPKTETMPGAESDRLPEKRPTDFTLNSHMDGGMSNHRSDLFISRDSCYFKDDDHGNVTWKKFSLSDAALDSLYSVLKENKFDQIVSTLDTLTLDRGGMDVYVYWEGGQRGVTANDSGQMFIKEESSKQWGAVLRYLDTLIPAQ